MKSVSTLLPRTTPAQDEEPSKFASKFAGFAQPIRFGPASWATATKPLTPTDLKTGVAVVVPETLENPQSENHPKPEQADAVATLAAASSDGSLNAISLQIIHDIPSPHPMSLHSAPLSDPWRRFEGTERQCACKFAFARRKSAGRSLAGLPEEYCRTTWLGAPPTSQRTRDCLRGIDPPRLKRIRPPPLKLVSTGRTGATAAM